MAHRVLIYEDRDIFANNDRINTATTGPVLYEDIFNSSSNYRHDNC